MRRNRLIKERDRLVAWLFFTVVVSLLPIAGSLLFDADHGDGFHPSHAVAHGELLVVSVTITAAAVGELLLTGVPADVKALALALIGSGVAILLIAGFWFADLSSLVRAPHQTHEISDTARAIGSLFVLGLSLFVSAQCLRVASRVHAA